MFGIVFSDWRAEPDKPIRLSAHITYVSTLIFSYLNQYQILNFVKI